MIENSNSILISDKKLWIKKINENLNCILQVFNQQHSKFSSENLNDLKAIIGCLQELENERFMAHSVWETESIKYEALRNKLVHYPIEITEEIERAIKGARGMNENTIRNLTQTLEKINSNIEKHSTDLDRFNLDNEKLIPEFEQMKVKHEEIVVLLNQHLSRKADKQIELNEIRNTIRDVNENIVQLEEDVFNLKETMINDRAIAREEKKRILSETNKTQNILDIQNAKNTDLNKIYQNLKHEATETSMAVTDKMTIYQKYIKTIGEIVKRQGQLEDSIENMTWSNAQIRQKIDETDKQIRESTYNFEEWQEQANEEIIMLSESVKMQEQILSELHFVKEEASEELEKSEKIKDEVSIHLRSLLDKFKEIDENSAAKVSDVGQLVYEMEEMERTILTSKENHEATVSAIKAHMSSLKKQLEKERKQRTDIQQNNNNLQDQINIFRGEHMKFMRDINSKIIDSKSEHSRLTLLYQQLKKKILEESDQAEKLKLLISKNKENLTREDTELTNTISQLNRKIFEMEKNESEKRIHLEENEPNLKELQIYHDKHMKDYEKVKKDLVALKSRKSGFDDSITRATKAFEKESATLKKLEEDKRLKEEKLDIQMQDEAKNRSDIEKNIYISGCKISTVKEEICRLQHEINKMNQKINLLRINWEQAIHVTSSIKQEITGQKLKLQDSWDKDRTMENTFKNDEISVMGRLKKLLKSTETRQVLIADISDKLFVEINQFDQFLNVMATISPRKHLELDKVKIQKLVDSL